MFSDRIADYVEAAAAKYLSAVDARPDRSNQHEIGGLVKVGFKEYLGEPARGDKFFYNARLAYISDEDDAPLTCNDIVTWYGATRKDPNRKLEYRLYYKSNEVTSLFNEGDFMLVAKLKDGSLLLVFTPAGGSTESQLKFLFGIEDVTDTFKRSALEAPELLLPLRMLLEDLGVVLEKPEKDDDLWLGKLTAEFGGELFPATAIFSKFARQTLGKNVSPTEEPDYALMKWMEHEEYLFRLYERVLVQRKLTQGFGPEGDDVDEFIGYSLSVQNRRKSRVGHAFESHLEALFQANRIRFERGMGKGRVTENNSKPDFIFPDFKSYQDPSYPLAGLAMLGAKTTCKDRWRQIMAEANRIERKHLVTLEAAISEAQTEEMAANQIQLVVPLTVQITYSPTQQARLQSVSEFIQEIRTKI